MYCLFVLDDWEEEEKEKKKKKWKAARNRQADFKKIEMSLPLSFWR